MEPEPHLPEHLQHLQMRNQRPRSVRERRLAVLRTRRRIGKPVAQATPDDLRAWQRDWILRLTPGGQHNEIAHTSQYLRWVYEQGHRSDDPTTVLIRPKVGQALPNPMPDRDLARAFHAAPQPIRAWIALAGFCGLRCMEIAELARADVLDADRPLLLRVTGKGGKTRIVPLPAVVLTELRAAGMPASGPLFARMDGHPGPPSAMRVSERLNDHLHSMGIAATAHSLRHRFGTALYRATRDPFLVARAMGHASTDTTKGYVLTGPFDAVDAVEQISRIP